jgi:hypothetical protein
MIYGYAVVEWNQASHQPEFADTDIYETPAEAEEQAQYYRERLKESGSGRRETWTITELVEYQNT